MDHVTEYNPDRPQLGQKEQLAEISVFLFLIVPSIILSFSVIKLSSLNFVVVAFATILRDLSLTTLILFFIWRNREPIGTIGWKIKSPWKDIALGFGLFIPFALGIGLIGNVLRLAGFSIPLKNLPSFLTPKSPGQYLLAVFLVGVVAFTEETIFRGYLMIRLKTVTASPVLAVFLSAAFFSLGHAYEGSAGVIIVGVMGLVLALIYRWRQSLVAPMVMHFLQDFLGIIVLPLLGKG